MNITYQFDSTPKAVSGYTPLTITFQPSNIPLTGQQFLSKVIYQFPDKVVTKVNTFASSNYSDDDCRTNIVYTVPDSNSTQVINISAYIGPDHYTATVYTLNVTNALPKFTRNPLASAESYAFGEVHLVKLKAWGPDNSQVIALETNNPNYLLLNYNG